MRTPAFFPSARFFSPAVLFLALAGCRTPASAPAAAPFAAAASDLAWPPIGREQKPWTRWWWLGNGVDRENLTRELTDFAAHGLGGVEVTPVYGAKGYDTRFIKFLSPDYISMLGYTVAEAHRLDLGVDMATTTGWPFGGPWVGPADVEQKVAFTNGRLTPKPTGFKVKRSAPGGEGPVVNPFSPGAVTRYLEPFTRALSALPPGSIHAQFQDSYEFTASWAAEVPDKFIAMHGYDLSDHLAELRGEGDSDTVARVKGDYRETLAELHLEYVRTWVDWSHGMGSLAREQAHGSPANLLDVYAVSDVPETEIFGSTPFPIPLYRNLPEEIGINVPPPLVNRMASSAAHVAGRPITSSETFTWVREHFHSAPSECKPELDQLLLTGINRIYYQGNAYSPSDAPWPGWLFYASIQENSRNSLWDELGWLNAYIARCSAMLQAGAPDNDLLVYWPVYDLWHDAAGRPEQHPDGLVKQFAVHNAQTWMNDTPCGTLAKELVGGGYAFDYISDAQLNQTEARDGGLKVPGGSYRAIVVPATAHLPVATLRRLLELAADGGTVAFVDALPADVPGYGQLAERRAEFQAELAKVSLQESAVGGLRTAAVGRGRVLVGPYASVVAQVGAAREPIADAGLGILRRRTAEGEIYFIANLTGKAFDGWTPLGRAARGAVLLDARSAQTGVAALRHGDGATEVYLQLQPGESIFVKTLRDREAQGARWAYAREAGPAVAIGASWRVAFTSGGPVLPPSFTESALTSWTDQGGEAERFAGTARYETEFTLPAGSAADDWMLDLGDLRETAKVWVNGTEVDRIWSIPFRTRVGAQLHPGRNTLALEVTNLSANRIRDLDRRKVPWKNFYEINFVNINYRRFDASHWPLQPSGLLGPVRLIPLHALAP
jgi:hypothetical protein